MNTRETKKLVQANGIIVMKADKTQPSPEIDKLLVELGNEAKAIPFYAIFPAGGGDPIVLDGLITPGQLHDALRRAGPSRGARATASSLSAGSGTSG